MECPSTSSASVALHRLEVLSSQVTVLPVATSSSRDGRPKVCLVLGAGAGVGMSVARRFADGGYAVALCRRTGQEALAESVRTIEEAGGRARGFLVDVTKPAALEDLVRTVEEEFGEIHVAVYNLGAQIGDRPLDTIELKTFELGWRMGCEGLFRLAKVLMPLMVKRGFGTLLVTSATAAVRGNRGQHSHAAAMGGRRMLCQTLNAEFAPKGIHVCHILVDGPVNSPDTLGKMLAAGKPGFGKPTDMTGDNFLQPVHMADSFFHVAHQHRSAWTFELDLRPSVSTAWWNHA